MKEIEIPEGYEARIVDNKVIFELRESEDERIRKHIIEILERLSPCHWDGNEKSECIAYLKRPAEWSEEDERIVCNLIRYFKGEEALRYSEEKTIEWLKSLRPQPYWKPSKEQMKVLKAAIVYVESSESNFKWSGSVLEALYNDLKKL